MTAPRSPTWSLSAVLCAACCGATVQPPASPDAVRALTDPSALGLTLERTEDASVQGGERLRLTLENKSDNWLWVNADLGLGPKQSASTLWADVLDEARGSPARWSCAQKTLPSGPARYLELPPSGRYSIVLPLSCYEFPLNGTTKIVVHFRDTPKSAPALGSTTSPWFRGQASSNALAISTREGLPIPSNVNTQSVGRQRDQ